LAEDPEIATPQPASPVAVTPAKAVSIYTIEEISNELRQGEILTGVVQYIYDPTKEGFDIIERPYVVILTQDCDLLWDFEARTKGEDRDLIGVLLYEAEPARNVRTTIGGRDIWKRIIQNKDERYHLLEEVPSQFDAHNEGLPALVIDFKRYFTLEPDEVYRQCLTGNGAKRRCRVETPYREHLQTRAASYLQRVTLPEPHKYVPPSMPNAPP